MSNRPKKGKPLHMLDGRRRGLTKSIFAQEQKTVIPRQSGRTLEYVGKVDRARYDTELMLKRIPKDKPIGLFLDDERFPDQVERCRSIPDIHWCIVRDMEEGKAFTKAVIEQGLKISIVSLDWDLSSVGCTYTGDHFFEWFWDYVRMYVHQPEKFPLPEDFLGVFIHSQAHESMLETMHQRRRDFNRWHRDIYYGS